VVVEFSEAASIFSAVRDITCQCMNTPGAPCVAERLDVSEIECHCCMLDETNSREDK
jgi:hypothetical protein